MLDRSNEYIASIIGVLKSGAAYSPLSMSYPRDRIEYIKKDSGADFVIDAEFLEGIDSEQPLDKLPEINMEDEETIEPQGENNGKTLNLICEICQA